MLYVKKPIKTEAIKTPDVAPSTKEYLQWSKNAPEWLHAHDIWMTEEGLIIPTLEGNMLCHWGDYILLGVKGEIYPCFKEVFEETYEPAEDTK